ncbi:YigZ family protein [Metamycoplasma spumans]|uniref:YigZ family protein n=1 Tax=Metamycoplasma spumans TaxID=92406 RepID=UPI000484A120
MKIIEIKKSKFVPYIFDIKNKEDIKVIFNNLKVEHKKSAHIVYAYLLKENNKISGGFNNDGEPCGGRKIYNILEIKKCENKAIFIVRYYGGIKLGASGLDRAFIKAAASLFE